MAISYALTVGLSRNSLYTAKDQINSDMDGAYADVLAIGVSP